MTVRIVALALTLVLLAACGAGDEVVSSDGPRSSHDPDQPQDRPDPAPAGQRYTATATVLESPEHGPQLCAATQDSYPPQCGGPDIIGWDWDAVPAKESANGTTWGAYTVVGTWDGSSLTLTEPPSEPRWDEAPDDGDRFATPCPEPDGGWQVVDPATATDEAMSVAMDHARAQPDFAGAWVDQSVNPASGREPVDEMAMNDPTRLVLNLRFTRHLDRYESEVRERWGGALCISEAPASLSELAAIRREVEDEIGARMTSSSIDEVTGRIEVGVYADEGLQARFDDRYGDGVVVVRGLLRPVEG